MRIIGGLAVVAAIISGATSDGPAFAQTKVRVGKAIAQNFIFVTADVGIAAGIFKKHGLEIETSAFGGGARLQQAMAADAVDIGLASGAEMAFVAKGAPVIAVAAMADAPGTILLTVLKDGPVKTVADLKDRKISVTTVGSLTYWLGQELSRQQGWGPDGIKVTPLGTMAAQTAALKTHQIDGMIVESSTAYKLEEEGSGRILVRFSERLKDFHVHVIYARREVTEKQPDMIRAFLAAWFDTIRYMREHKAETIEIASRVAEVSKSVSTRNYDELMPIFNGTGKFNPKALDVLARSYVEMGMLSAVPDMSKAYTEAFLPKK